MNITIIGYGHVGSTLADRLAKVGYSVHVGVRDTTKRPVRNKNISFHSIPNAIERSGVIIIAIPAQAIPDVAKILGDVSKKTIIETSNIVHGPPDGFISGFDALVALTNGKHIVKAFNAVGADNMAHTNFDGTKIDMFMAGDSTKGKRTVKKLAKELGFGEIWDFGGNEKVILLERFGNAWINLAINQGYGRKLAFKILKRK